MRSRQPPAFATKLLGRLVVGPNREALAGDLIEQYQSGRSRGWYWRQVLTAIAVDVASYVRTHKLALLFAVAIGWAFTHLVGQYVEMPLARGMGVPVQNWMLMTGHETLRWWWWRLEFPRTLFNFTELALSGFLVARFDRANRPPLLLAYFAARLPIRMCYLSWVRWHYTPFFVYGIVINVVVILIAIPFSMLIARSWEAPPEERHQIAH